jgi:hypothetical protein
MYRATRKHCISSFRMGADHQLLYPLDVVKTRQQLEAGKGGTPMLQTFRNIIGTQGYDQPEVSLTSEYRGCIRESYPLLCWKRPNEPSSVSPHRFPSHTVRSSPAQSEPTGTGPASSPRTAPARTRSSSRQPPGSSQELPNLS